MDNMDKVLSVLQITRLASDESSSDAGLSDADDDSQPLSELAELQMSSWNIPQK